MRDTLYRGSRAEGQTPQPDTADHRVVAKGIAREGGNIAHVMSSVGTHTRCYERTNTLINAFWT